MDHFSKLEHQIRLRIFLGTTIVGASAIFAYWIITTLELGVLLSVLAAALTICILGMVVSSVTSKQALEPTKTIWRAMLHIDPSHHGETAPNLAKIRLGRELITKIVLDIYQFASQQNSKELLEHRQKITQSANIVNHLPLPLFVFNKELLVTTASSSAYAYCNINSADLLGKSLFDTLRLEFTSDHTLNAWITDCQKNKISDTAFWERVHILSKEDNSLLKQCDIAAFYNKDNPSGTEFIVTLFDRTDRYTRDDDALNFVALAVHELRTPITMLRGYIEVFEDELHDKLDDELNSFMTKMDDAAKRLSNFVSNILNTARIEQNQLELHLTEEAWADTLRTNTADVEIRAKIHGKQIEFDIADNLPPVAVDKTSIYEVLTNLVENAIKYSGEQNRIVIKTNLSKAGMIETTIQDFGAGIPSSVLPNLFEKFSRNHRTRANVSGTGLGLYLSKAIITAHGGQIWASSKEGEGSTFGFTLVPYAQITDAQKAGDNKEITRNASGWIKNHSLYRK